MTLRERLERLEDRERRLLGALSLVVVVVILLLIPVAVTAALHGTRSQNDELRAVIERINAEHAVVQKARAQRRAIEERYAHPAPPLTSFLAKLAQETELEIPETQDRQPVPHGKRYEEKSTKIVLRKTGMLKALHFMERIEQSGHPVSITQLTIRKRGVEADSYDIDMVVSAFERKVDKTQPKSKAAPAASAEAAGQKEGE
jgi:hypothetical protein